MRRFVFTTAGCLLVTAALVAAAGCDSFSADATAADGDARSETAPGDETGVVGADADAAVRALEAIYGVTFGSATDAGDAGAVIFPTGMVVEPSGGVALVGTYGYGPVDVGGDTLPTPSAADAFLLRLDATGTRVSSKPFDSADDQYGATLAGSSDKLYASFQIDGTMTFGDSESMTSDSVGTKFNSATVRFVSNAVSSGFTSFKSTSNALIKGTALGAGESVVTFGDWDDNLVVNGGSSVQRSPGKLGLFVARTFVVSGKDIVRTDLCDDGTTCVASALASSPLSGESLAGGRYTGHISGADGGGITTALNDNDGYVMKLDANLFLQWVVALRGSGVEEVLAATSIPGGDYIVAGSFDGTLELTGASTVSTRGKADVYVARLDANGKVVWVRTFGGLGKDLVRAVAADAAGNVFVTGHFNGPTFEIGNTVLKNADITGLGTSDVFVAWLDSAGNPIYGARFGGGGNDDASAIGIDGTGNVVIAGSFDSTIDFGKGVLTARGRTDMFVAKFRR